MEASHAPPAAPDAEPAPDAGINTGFGNFARVRIPDHQLVQLQENLIRSHAAGVGTPLSRPRTRMLLALRINVLAKGHSGISEKTLRQIIGAFGWEKTQDPAAP